MNDTIIARESNLPGEMNNRNTLKLSSGYVILDHGLRHSSTFGSICGTKRPPSAAYPLQMACSNVTDSMRSRVDVYLIPSM